MSRQLEKKLVKQQYLLHMSWQYCELRPTNGWDRLTSLGHPCKFQLFSYLGSVTAQRLVEGVSQTLRRWTEGATYIRQGDHHVGHWPTFLVVYVLYCVSMYIACMCSIVTWWGVPGEPLFLQCFDTVGWVIWPIKPVPDMTYNVFNGTLNPAKSINLSTNINIR